MLTGWRRPGYIIQFDEHGNATDHSGAAVGEHGGQATGRAPWVDLDKGLLTENLRAQVPDAAQATRAASAGLTPTAFIANTVHCRDLQFPTSDFAPAANGPVISRVSFFVYVGAVAGAAKPSLTSVRLFFHLPGTVATWATPTLVSVDHDNGVWGFSWENDGRLTAALLYQRENPQVAGFGLQFVARGAAGATAGIIWDGIEAQVEYSDAVLVDLAATVATASTAAGALGTFPALLAVKGWAEPDLARNFQDGFGADPWAEAPRGGRTPPLSTDAILGTTLRVPASAGTTATGSVVFGLTSAMSAAVSAALGEGNAHLSGVAVVVALERDRLQDSPLGPTRLRAAALTADGLDIPGTAAPHAAAVLQLRPVVYTSPSGHPLRIYPDAAPVQRTAQMPLALYRPDAVDDNAYAEGAAGYLHSSSDRLAPPDYAADGVVQLVWDAAQWTASARQAVQAAAQAGMLGVRVQLDKNWAYTGSEAEPVYVWAPPRDALSLLGYSPPQTTAQPGAVYVDVRWDVLAARVDTTSYVSAAQLVVDRFRLYGLSADTSAAAATLGVAYHSTGVSATLSGATAGLGVDRQLGLPDAIRMYFTMSATLRRGYDFSFAPVSEASATTAAGALLLAYQPTATTATHSATQADLTATLWVTGAAVIARLTGLLPGQWFGTRPSDAVRVRDTFEGASAAFSDTYSLMRFVEANTRLRHASGGYLDIIAHDFFGPRRQRRRDETDSSYRPRIQRSLLRERVTRDAVVGAIADLTGATPRVFEPSQPRDTGAYNVAASLAYGDSTAALVDPLAHPGGYGSMTLPHTAFLSVSLPPAIGIPLVQGYSGLTAGYAATEFVQFPERGDALWGFGTYLAMYASSVPEPDAVTVTDVSEILGEFGGAGAMFWLHVTTRSA
jgi:hypothetical protein